VKKLTATLPLAGADDFQSSRDHYDETA
jgi:hypothetical protein